MDRDGDRTMELLYTSDRIDGREGKEDILNIYRIQNDTIHRLADGLLNAIISSQSFPILEMCPPRISRPE